MKPTQMLKILPALAVALFLAAGEVPEAQAQGAPECGCAALRNVKNRLCTVRAAQREYQRIAASFLANEKAGGKPVFLDTENWGNIKTCLQDAVNQATDKDAQNASGDTDRKCNIVVKTANPDLPNSKCIEAVVRRHEEHHRAECLKREEDKWWKAWSEDIPATSVINTFFGGSAVDYMAEERTAYFQEEMELTETLRRLLKTCKEADKVLTVSDDGIVPGKKKGEKYHLNPSVDPCPAAPKTYGKCPY